MHMMLRADVFMARSDDMLVFLDLARDRYCALDLAWSARASRSAGAGDADEELIALLEKAGLLAVSAAGRSFAPTDYAPPRAELDRADARFNPLDAIRALASRAAAARALKRRRLADIVRERRDRRARWTCERRAGGDYRGALARGAMRFTAQQPSAAREGACLENALALLYFLGPAGASADWTFAVRAVPFTAHCWVQHDGVVLNDTLANTQGYAPIMIV